MNLLPSGAQLWQAKARYHPRDINLHTLMRCGIAPASLEEYLQRVETGRACERLRQMAIQSMIRVQRCRDQA